MTHCKVTCHDAHRFPTQPTNQPVRFRFPRAAARWCEGLPLSLWSLYQVQKVLRCVIPNWSSSLQYLGVATLGPTFGGFFLTLTQNLTDTDCEKWVGTAIEILKIHLNHPPHMALGSKAVNFFPGSTVGWGACVGIDLWWRCLGVAWCLVVLRCCFCVFLCFLHLSNEKITGCLGYIVDYTTQLYGD